MEITVIGVTFSLKNIAIITATITGYTNNSVEAIPASMKLKLPNSVSDDTTINTPNTESTANSRLVMANDFFCASIIRARIAVASP